MDNAKKFLEDLKKAHSLSTVGEWKSCAVTGGEGYANYGVTSHDTMGGRAYPNVVYAHTDWEGYGNGSKLADTLFIAEAHNKLPVVISALETIINMANNNGSVTKEEIEEILVWGDISK